MKKRMAAALVALSTLALAGCEVSGVAQRAPLDIDAGPYQTKSSEADMSSPAWTAGAQLGAYVPFPSELDNRLVRTVMGTTPVGSLKNLRGQIAGADKVPENSKFQFGFAAAANDSDPYAATTPRMTRSLSLAVFRYTDADAVRAAIRPTAEAYRDETVAARKRIGISTDPLRVEPAGADMPAGTYVTTYPLATGDAGIAMQVLVPHGRDMLAIDSYGRSPEETSTLLKRAVAMMTERLKGSEDVSEANAMRESSFITLTVPFRESGSRTMFDGTVIGPKSYAHVFHDPTSGLRTLTDAGVDLIGVRESVLFRTSSEQKATTLLEAYGSWAPDADERKAGSPRDLPSAKCTQSKDAGGTSTYTCAVVVGRYYARASSLSTLLDAQQMISAQYLILKERG